MRFDTVRYIYTAAIITITYTRIIHHCIHQGLDISIMSTRSCRLTAPSALMAFTCRVYFPLARFLNDTPCCSGSALRHCSSSPSIQYINWSLSPWL